MPDLPGPGPSFDWIVSEYARRRSSDSTVMAQMRNARDHFNGDIVVPLPEMDEREKPAIANLLTQGLDQTAMRVASTLPYIHYPAMTPGKDRGPKSEDYARTRRLANAAWWQQSKMKMLLRRHARWLIGYARAPMVVLPDHTHGIPRYELRHPLGTYPSPNVAYNHEQPTDSIFVYRRTFRWLMASYPDTAEAMRRRHGKLDPESSIDLLEYFDDEVRVMGAVATHATLTGATAFRFGSDELQAHEVVAGWELERIVNRSGICQVVDTARITIDKTQGQFDQVFGLFQNQARLMALETIAVEKGIFPDLALIGTQPGRTPMLENGQWADGRTGEINIVRDGRVDTVQLNPSFMTQPLIDRYERGIRTAGVPAQFSGESPTNIATGRLGDGILSATVDFPIQEYQEVTADSLYEANRRAVAVARGWFGSRKQSFYVNFGRDKGHVDYEPNKHFETDFHEVKYSAPGADINSLVIGIGQRIGLGTLSVYSAMFQDPMVEDPEFEYRKVTSEKLQGALVEFISMQVAQGALDPRDVVFVIEEVEKGNDLAEAFAKAQERAQERQAEAHQGQVPAEMEPGLTLPGEEGAEPPPAVGAPQPSMTNLSQMLSTLRQPRSIMPPMQQGPGVATPPNTPVG